MPIKDQTIYPPYWKQFSLHIRVERAESRCEQCDVENYSINARGSKVVLTVAHLDDADGVCKCKASTGRKCAIPEHVLALCQACHLRMDMPKHIENRRKTLAVANDEKRGLLAEIR